VELIDGHPVMEHQIRFRLRATVDEHYAGEIRDGETMVWLVQALCKPPQYYPLGKDADERYKLAVQDVQAAAPLVGEGRASALAYLDGAGDQLVLPFHGEDEATELRAYLATIGELNDDERLIDAFHRLTTPSTVVVEQEPAADAVPPEVAAERAAVMERAMAVLRDPEPPQPHSLPAPAAPDRSDVEVVGSIYRGRRSELSDLLNTKFGEP